MNETINVKELLNSLDSLFAQNKIKEAGAFLDGALKEAREIGDSAAEITILNELIGYHRRSGKKDEALKAIDEALKKITEQKLTNTVTHANTLLNSATTLKAFGMSCEALPLYTKAEELYISLLPPNDYRFAGLYNNFALALVDENDLRKAEILYKKALDILSFLGGNYGEKAVTYCNMSFLYEKSGNDEKLNACLDSALDALNENDAVRDGYYAFNCEKCADAFKYFGRFSEQWELEERAKKIYEANRNI